MKNWEIIENVWKILPGDGSQKQEVSRGGFDPEIF